MTPDDPACAACGLGVACPESCCAVSDGAHLWHEECAPEHLIEPERAERLRERAERLRARSAARSAP